MACAGVVYGSLQGLAGVVVSVRRPGRIFAYRLARSLAVSDAFRGAVSGWLTATVPAIRS